MGARGHSRNQLLNAFQYKHISSTYGVQGSLWVCELSLTALPQGRWAEASTRLTCKCERLFLSRQSSIAHVLLWLLLSQGTERPQRKTHIFNLHCRLFLASPASPCPSFARLNCNSWFLPRPRPQDFIWFTSKPHFVLRPLFSVFSTSRCG